ncbi:MAG: iron export ABC transporter permease subunit FetB [Methanosarcinales archaeon Met12]|nr:MAG: iron export ABC transporter permease subunit FetB [Methanosarcinales archaeon Met12]
MIEVFCSLLLILLAILLSYFEKLDLERDILIATIRAFFQLMAVGLAIHLIFEIDDMRMVIIMIGVMVAIAGYTSGIRVAYVPNSMAYALLAISLSTSIILGIMLVFDIIYLSPRYVIPIAGMVIGNSMTVASLSMDRLHNEIRSNWSIIEGAISLGASNKQASRSYLKNSIRVAMISSIDTTKTVGLVYLPGGMAGMILGGAAPIDAVKLQIIIMYMLIAAAMITSMVVSYASCRALLPSSR